MLEERELKDKAVAYALENGRDRDEHASAESIVSDAKVIYKFLSEYKIGDED